MRTTVIGKVRISRLCIGGNPFSGFSHQGEERTRAMLAYYTPARIKQTWQLAEKLGINTFFGRTDDHIMGLLREYWEEDGKIQWFAQYWDEDANPGAWKKKLADAVKLGAKGAYMHGGVTDFWFANKMFDNFRACLDTMRAAGVAAGFAGHNPAAHAWIRAHLDVDFQMCSHYNPTDRSKSSKHISIGEKWNDEDRENMLGVIPKIRAPVVHYKVFGGGNKPIIPAFEILAKNVRPKDIVCLGVFLKDDPEMLAKDIALFEKYVDHGKC